MTEIMHWEDGRNKKQTRQINRTIDIEKFADSAGGYPLLFLAANTHLSAMEVWRYLRYIKGKPNERSLSWIKKRRRMFVPPDFSYGTREDIDGRAKQAIGLMADNPGMSLYDLVCLLRKHGIERSREWVRLHRCDGVNPN